jgi:hypothetical protein
VVQLWTLKKNYYLRSLLTLIIITMKKLLLFFAVFTIQCSFVVAQSIDGLIRKVTISTELDDLTKSNPIGRSFDTGMEKALNCVDTVIYPLYKELVVGTETFGGLQLWQSDAESLSQFFSAPGVPMSVSGVQFFAGKATGSTPNCQVSVKLFNVNANKIPTTQIAGASTVVTFDNAAAYRYATFPTPVSIVGDYAIVLEPISVGSRVTFYTNDMDLNPSYDENLARIKSDYYTPPTGFWQSILDLTGNTEDWDWIVAPIVSYAINTTFTVASLPACVGEELTFTNTTNASIHNNRMYNFSSFYNYFIDDESPFYFDYENDDQFVPVYGTTSTYTYTSANTYAAVLYTLGGLSNYWGCTDVGFEVITVNALPTVTASSNDLSNEFCQGESVILNGGGAQTYIWNNGAVNNVGFAATTNNTYQVTGTDANGCSNTATISITVFDVPTIIGTPSNATGCGTADGGIEVTVTGGAPTYGYLWNGTIPTQNLENVIAGNYTLVVTDQNGCTATYIGVVGEDGAAVISLAITEAILCNGQTGEITLSSADDLTDYTFAWTPAPVATANNNTIIEVTAGTYAVAGSGNGCTVNANITITQPAAISASAVGTNISCNGLTDGFATVTASGGTAPLSISPAQTGLAAGPHTFVVVDDNGCTVSTNTITIVEPAVLTATAAAIDITCFGAANGAANVTTAGGTGAITVTPSTTGLTAGTYSFTAEDANGCSATTNTVTVSEPTAIIGSADVSNTSDDTTPNGSIDLTVGGGTGALTFNWFNTANPGTSIGNTEDLTGIGAGSYSVTVTDANNCEEVFGPYVIGSTASIADAGAILFNIYPNPSNGLVNVAGENIQSIQVLDVIGKVVYIYDAPVSGQLTMDLSALSNGTYFLLIMANDTPSVNKIQLKK